MNDTKQSVSEKSPEYLAATLREVAEMLEDVGKTIDARLGAWRADKPGTATEPEPYIEIGPYRFTRIEQFQRGAHARWCVCGWCAQVHVTHELAPDETPFSIWQAAVAAGVPCCEPPTVDADKHHRILCVHKFTGLVCGGIRVDATWQWETSPIERGEVTLATNKAKLRAACAEKGVPCPEEEKPKTVDIISANTGGIVHLRDLRPIEALIDPEHGPCLRVNGYVTKAPISDIRKQAAEAGIDLPPVTVRAVREWTSIGRVEVKAASNDGLFCTVRGASDGRYVVQEFAPEVAEVLAICELAGWPKPEVRMVCTYADGSPCDVDPREVVEVNYNRFAHATTVVADHGSGEFVREPVAVVEAMRAACKEGE